MTIAPRVAGGATICTRAPSGRGGGQQGVLAIDPLVGGCGDLGGEPPQRLFGQLRRRVALRLPAQGLHPDLAGGVDQDVGDVGPRQPRRQGPQIGFQIDALLRAGRQAHGLVATGLTAEKSRSRATKDADRRPLGHLDGGRDVGQVGLGGQAGRVRAAADVDRVAVVVGQGRRHADVNHGQQDRPAETLEEVPVHRPRQAGPAQGIGA